MTEDDPEQMENKSEVKLELKVEEKLDSKVEEREEVVTLRPPVSYIDEKANTHVIDDRVVTKNNQSRVKDILLVSRNQQQRMNGDCNSTPERHSKEAGTMNKNINEIVTADNNTDNRRDGIANVTINDNNCKSCISSSNIHNAGSDSNNNSINTGINDEGTSFNGSNLPVMASTPNLTSNNLTIPGSTAVAGPRISYDSDFHLDFDDFEVNYHNDVPAGMRTESESESQVGPVDTNIREESESGDGVSVEAGSYDETLATNNHFDEDDDLPKESDETLPEAVPIQPEVFSDQELPSTPINDILWNMGSRSIDNHVVERIMRNSEARTRILGTDIALATSAREGLSNEEDSHDNNNTPLLHCEEIIADNSENGRGNDDSTSDNNSDDNIENKNESHMSCPSFFHFSKRKIIYSAIALAFFILILLPVTVLNNTSDSLRKGDESYYSIIPSSAPSVTNVLNNTSGGIRKGDVSYSSMIPSSAPLVIKSMRYTALMNAIKNFADLDALSNPSSPQYIAFNRMLNPENGVFNQTDLLGQRYALTVIPYALKRREQKIFYEVIEGFFTPGNECAWGSPWGTTLKCVEGLVIRLDLSNEQYVGSIPYDIGGLSNLREFRANDNMLHGTIPETLSRLTAARTIDINNNNLSGTIPYGLFDGSKMKSLKTFHLRNNKLTGTIPSSLVSLSLLEDLDFRNNDLSGPIPVGISEMPNLKNFCIDKEIFRDTDITKIKIPCV